MSSEPLLPSCSRRDSSSSSSSSETMPTKDSVLSVEGDRDLEFVEGHHVLRAGSKPVPEDDRAAPSEYVGSQRQRISDLWTILCSGCALISDGYANSLMTLINVVLRVEYRGQYTSDVSTRVSNALLVGEILGQITIG